MKIAFIGEAVSGFGGMETVISNVIHTFENSSPKINCEMFFFCRNDKMAVSYTQSRAHETSAQLVCRTM
ncbi:hypothetical protein M1742_05255, partial [Salmonella enterica subsp. enterica serovar Typhimurium]|nr:hypothetical protein [Salmonella enterica subsp. enterica serovar Typhimurium]